MCDGAERAYEEAPRSQEMNHSPRKGLTIQIDKNKNEMPSAEDLQLLAKLEEANRCGTVRFFPLSVVPLGARPVSLFSSPVTDGASRTVFMCVPGERLLVLGPSLARFDYVGYRCLSARNDEY